MADKYSGARVLNYLLPFFLVVVSSNSMAQSDPAKAALAKAQYMLRQVSAEKSTLEVEVAGLKNTIADLEEKLEAVESSSEKNKKSANSQISSLKKENSDIYEKLESETVRNKDLLDENEHLYAKLDEKIANFQVCFQNNQALFQINNEILGEYEEKGFWRALTQKESFTSIQKVRVENMVQDYKFAIEDLQVDIVSNDLD